MQLSAIITLANAPVELAFRAMERSLRATGCTLPLWVIPYDDRKFALPESAQWMEDAESLAVYKLLQEHKSHPTFRKYACLLKENFIFVDTDVAFLKDPAEALKPYEGFVVNCCHWMSAEHILTEEARPFFEGLSTTYQKTLFNTGQWACDRKIYNLETLKAACGKWPQTCIYFPYHEQPGVNVLVHASGVPMTSLTLPPYNIESSWAGHYEGRTEPYWSTEAKKPFMLHWAGRKFSGKYAVDEIFLKHLTAQERSALLRTQGNTKRSFASALRGFARGVRQAFNENFKT